MSETSDDLLKCRVKEKETNSDTCVVFIGKLGEKRSVPLTSLRPLSGTECIAVESHRRDPYMKSASKIANKYGYGSLNVALHTQDKEKKLDSLVLDYDAICEISKTLDFESYINLSNIKFTSNQQQELIAYPMLYAHTNNMTSNNSNGNLNTGGPKKSRNQNASIQSHMQHDATDKPPHGKMDDENSYGKNVLESKPDSQSNQANDGYYQQQPQDQNVDGSVPMNQQVPGYYHQTGVAPIYYCPTPEYNESNVYTSEMVMPQGVYAVPAHAYQVPQMQPNIYAPVAANPAAPYPVNVGNWPAYNPQVNPQGKSNIICGKYLWL